MLNYLYFSYDKIVFVLDKQEFMEGRMIDYCLAKSLMFLDAIIRCDLFIIISYLLNRR